jgi:hypothetical protein
MNKFLAFTLAFGCVLPVSAKDRPKKTVDPDDAYKNNCMRCHSAVRHYSPRMTATIVNHMRVRANMTEEETQAILEYLTESVPAKSTPVAAYGAR